VARTITPEKLLEVLGSKVAELHLANEEIALLRQQLETLRRGDADLPAVDTSPFSEQETV